MYNDTRNDTLVSEAYLEGPKTQICKFTAILTRFEEKKHIMDQHANDIEWCVIDI